MLALLLALAAVCSVARTGDGKIARSRDVARSFRHQYPCPDGPDKGSKKHCRNYVVDHILPRCAGGADEPSNMQWQPLAESREKDKAEVALCRWIDKACGRPWESHRRKR